MTVPKKRTAGRPRLHKDTELVTFRCPTQVAVVIRGALATLRTANPQGMKTPNPVFLIEALKLRLKLLENMRPVPVRAGIKALDRVLDASYGHVERDQ